MDVFVGSGEGFFGCRVFLLHFGGMVFCSFHFANYYKIFSLFYAFLFYFFILFS
jgi:hypothetical protein